MNSVIAEIIKSFVAAVLALSIIGLANSSTPLIHSAAAQSDGLEKISQDGLLGNIDGTVATGGDVIGALRFYQGTSSVAVTVSGWGGTHTYSGTYDFSNLSGDLNFFKSKFKVTVLNSNVTYTKL